jgi:5-formyltetrahydrofolate cyclo-ligase
MEGEQLPTAEKARLRSAMAARRDALDGRAARSAAICARVIGLPQFQAAPSIHCFLPMRSEVDTQAIVAAALAAGKAVAVPVSERDEPLSHSWISSLEPAAFVPGGFGTLRPRIRLPAAPGTWALTIVPLLAFDREGFRLGYGKGHYDALLASAPTFAVGVAFAAQEQPCLPRESHDQPLNLIVTEDELIRSAARPGKLR